MTVGAPAARTSSAVEANGSLAERLIDDRVGIRRLCGSACRTDGTTPTIVSHGLGSFWAGSACGRNALAQRILAREESLDEPLADDDSLGARRAVVVGEQAAAADGDAEHVEIAGADPQPRAARAGLRIDRRTAFDLHDSAVCPFQRQT